MLDVGKQHRNLVSSENNYQQLSEVKIALTSLSVSRHGPVYTLQRAIEAKCMIMVTVNE